MQFSTQVCIGSFNNARINVIINELGPETCHSMGTSNVIKFFIGAQLGIKQNFTSQCIQLPINNLAFPLLPEEF